MTCIFVCLTFIECLEHLLKTRTTFTKIMTWIFTKQPGHLLNVPVSSGLDCGLYCNLDSRPSCVFIILGYQDPDQTLNSLLEVASTCLK